MPTSDYTPSVEQVASLLRARTRTSTGVEVGTFNDDTRPTEAEAQGMIDEAVIEISLIAGADIPDWPGEGDENVSLLRVAATGVVSLLAAMNIEASFRPEQVNDDNSLYDKLERRYLAMLKMFMSALENLPPSGDGDAEVTTGETQYPAGVFPSPEILVGWNTQFD